MKKLQAFFLLGSVAALCTIPAAAAAAGVRAACMAGPAALFEVEPGRYRFIPLRSGPEEDRP